MAETARQLAVRILAAYKPEVTNLSQLINSVLDQHGMQCPDKGFARSLVWGVVRRMNTLDFIANSRLKDVRHTDATVRAILRLGIYQLMFMGDRVPPYAAVNESVALAKACHKAKASGMVNAVMRRLSEETDLLAKFSADTAENMALKYSYPHWLIKRWFSRFGVTETELMCIANNDPGYLTLRVNTLKTTREKAIASIPVGFSAECTRFSTDGINLEAANPQLELLTGMNDGSLLVQDEASQMIAHLVQPIPGQTILDACCGSGTKTAHIAALAGNKIAITAIDTDKRRIAQATETFKRMGVTCAEATVADAVKFTGTFDTVLLDAPCSGIGTLRKKPDIKWNRAQSDITKKYPVLQLSLLRHLSTLVKDGGSIIYSTCTNEPEETNQVIDSFVEENTGFAPVELDNILPTELLSGDKKYFRTWPHKQNMDGFFAVKLVKTK
jgi:16S rRNA (cytosine967-C5)-methyltransferase